MACRIRKFKKNIKEYVPGSNKEIIYGNIKEILHQLPLLKGNFSIYEKQGFSKNPEITYEKIEDALHEIPLIPRKLPINEIAIQDVPAHLHTKPTAASIKYILKRSILTEDFINPIYYKEKSNAIAMCIIVAWNTHITEIERNNIISLFKTCGYFLSNDRTVKDNGEEYTVALFEPYWPDVDMIRKPDIVYHITPQYNEKSIDKNGFITQSKSNRFDYPDRVYFFMTDDRVAMFNHIRASGKIKNINENVVIYKTSIPDNITLYLDSHVFDTNNEYIEDCVFSYNIISPNNIISKEILPIKGQIFKMNQK